MPEPTADLLAAINHDPPVDYDLQQLIVLRHHCREEGWYRLWPALAKLLKRGVDAPPNRLTHSQRSQLSTRAAHSSWARTVDRAVRTAPARAALMARFERTVDPESTLPLVQRQQLAAHAKRAHFAGLALRSSVSRARKRG